MGLRRNRRAALVLSLLLVAAAAAYYPLSHLVFAFRLLLAARNLAAGATGEDVAVVQTEVRRHMGERELAALLYRPARSLPKSAAVLVPGISELGWRHPRLMALARTLADKGFLVVTPDIEMFRRFEVAPEAIEEFSFWHGQIPGLEGGAGVQRSGIIGISFSGTMGLIAAARPGMRDTVAFVMAIGPYQDLFRCARGWFAAGPATVGEGYYPTRFYGKWIIMLAALDMVHDGAERRFLGEILRSLLLQRPPRPAPETLSPQARRWHQLALMSETQTDAGLFQEIEDHLTPLYQVLSPDRAAAEVRCPVFLAHGAYDDLIPPEESVELKKRIPNSYLLISPFLTHTHPLEKPLVRREKAAAIWEMLVFFYRLSGAVR